MMLFYEVSSVRTHHSYHPSPVHAVSTSMHSTGFRKPWRTNFKARVSAMCMCGEVEDGRRWGLIGRACAFTIMEA